MDSLDAVIEAKIGGAFQGDTGRLVAQEIANAVRAYLESDEVVEAVKRGIAADTLAVMGDYDEVPANEVFTRPRYQWIRMRLDTIARAALQAAGGKRDAS